MTPVSNCRVVLVRTHYAGNLGATARVMHNFGLSQLLLVDPQADPNDCEARRLSTHGEFILDRARIVADLQTAVADCHLVVATSSQAEGVFRATTASPIRPLMPQVAAGLNRGPVALVFGPEPSGLTNAEVAQCHHLLSIPTSTEYPALNLAQAVAICLYELSQTLQTIDSPVAALDMPGSYAEQDRTFLHLQHGLEAIHFLYGPKAEALMHALRHLLSRAQPTAAELRLLHGLARQLEWVSANGAAGNSDQPAESLPAP